MSDEPTFTDPDDGPGPDDAAPGVGEVGGAFDAPLPEERTWAAIAHGAGVASSVFLPILISLVIYHVKKDESRFVADQAREALNFQITIALAMLVALTSLLCVVGFALVPLVTLASLVFGLIGAIKAHEGERYRYPFTLRFV